MTNGQTPPRSCAGWLVVALIGLAGAVSACGGTKEDRPATWSYISTAILEPSCATANCHSAIAARASVDLSTRDAGYASLTSRNFVITSAAATAATKSGTPAPTDDERVARSAVPQLMRAVGNIRMPPDMPLPETDILLFEAWIRNGALKD